MRAPRRCVLCMRCVRCELSSTPRLVARTGAGGGSVRAVRPGGGRARFGSHCKSGNLPFTLLSWGCPLCAPASVGTRGGHAVAAGADGCPFRGALVSPGGPALRASPQPNLLSRVGGARCGLAPGFTPGVGAGVSGSGSVVGTARTPNCTESPKHTRTACTSRAGKARPRLGDSRVCTGGHAAEGRRYDGRIGGAAPALRWRSRL